MKFELERKTEGASSSKFSRLLSLSHTQFKIRKLPSMVRPSTADATWTSNVKFVYSYGGKIIIRHTDGKLRYFGGHTRVLAVHRSIPFPELLWKLGELCGTTVSVRCQLPTEDLDALVSITCDEDLANIIEEYDRLSSTPFPLKIRAYLSSPKNQKNTTTASTNITSFTYPRHLFSASSKSSLSSTSTAFSSRTLSAAGIAPCGAVCRPRYSMMPMEGDCSMRQQLFPPLSFPMGLEKSKAKIANHYQVSHPEYCCHG